MEKQWVLETCPCQDTRTVRPDRYDLIQMPTLDSKDEDLMGHRDKSYRQVHGFSSPEGGGTPSEFSTFLPIRVNNTGGREVVTQRQFEAYFTSFIFIFRLEAVK